jgi:hypothetical protein
MEEISIEEADRGEVALELYRCNDLQGFIESLNRSAAFLCEVPHEKGIPAKGEGQG